MYKIINLSRKIKIFCSNAGQKKEEVENEPSEVENALQELEEMEEHVVSSG